MMKCRGMGAAKPKVMAKGKKVPGKVKKYNVGGSASAPRENFGRPIMEGVYQARANQAMKSGRRMAKGKTVKRKMKGKKV